MQNYGGYYTQYPQGQNQMYQGSGGQNNPNQTNMRNMFGGTPNYGGPQIPQQQYGYQQQMSQQQMPQQQNFVFHFDLNNPNPSMNMNMGPYAPGNTPYGAQPYGGPSIPPNGPQKKENKNDELFNSFDPFNPKPRTNSKPRSQSQSSAPKQEAPSSQPQIQLIEDNIPKKQDLNAFRSAFASLAAPSQQPQQQSQQQQQYGYGQSGQMYSGTMNAPPAPQIEGFNFVGPTQNPPQIEGFTFGSPQESQSTPFPNMTTPQQPQNASFSNQQFPPQQNSSFQNQASPQQSSQPTSVVASTPIQNAATISKTSTDDPFSNFNPLSTSQQKTSNQDPIADISGNLVPSSGPTSNISSTQQYSDINDFAFNQPQTGSNGGIQSFNHPQNGSNDEFMKFNNPPAKTISGFPTPQPQAGSGGGFASFDQPQPGSTGKLPLSEIDDLFGSPVTTQQNASNSATSNEQASNPFLTNHPSDSNPFTNQSQKAEQSAANTSNNPFISTPIPNTNVPQQQQQQQGSNGFTFTSTSFDSNQNQQQPNPSRTGASSFGDSFRQTLAETAPSPSDTTANSSNQKENEVSDFQNIFKQGSNFFEKQEEQLKSQQQQQASPDGFNFGSQGAATPAGDSGAQNFSNFVFNSESNQNSQFGNSAFTNFGNNESSITAPPPQITDQSNQEPPTTQFAPFGVSDLQPMSNSTFVINESGDSFGSQPTIAPAAPVDESKIPYFVEEEKKKELENRIKNDTMIAFDPFNPNPQPIQPQPQQQQKPQEKPQNEVKKQEEPIQLSASVNASVDTIRNMFGGHSESDESDKKEEENNENKEENEKNDDKKEPFNPFVQNDESKNIFAEQSKDSGSQNVFLSAFGSENNESKKKEGSDIQLNVGLGENKEEDNPFTSKDNSFQPAFGSSPEGNPFGFGGFGFNNSFGKGNVFQHALEQGDMDKPATFADFFPHNNSQPLTPPIPTDENKDNEKSQQQEPAKSVTPFAPPFDLINISSENHQNQNENAQKQGNEEKPKEQNIDFDNPFIGQGSFSLFGQQQQQQQSSTTTNSKAENENKESFNPFATSTTSTSTNANAQNEKENKESFNPFAAAITSDNKNNNNNSNLNLTLETQSSLSLSESSMNETKNESSSKMEVKKKDSKSSKKKGKSDDIFDEIPDDISQIDTTLPEKPPPFIMPTIGDSSSNPFANVLNVSQSSNSNPFTSSSASKNDNPFIMNPAGPASNPFTSQPAKTETKEEAKEETNENVSNPFTSHITKTETKEETKEDDSNPFVLHIAKTETKEETKDDDSNPFAIHTANKENENENKETKAKNDFDDLLGFGFDFSSKPKTEEKEEKTKKKDDDTFFGAFSTPAAAETESTTKPNEEAEEKKFDNPFFGAFSTPAAAEATPTTKSNEETEEKKFDNPFFGAFSAPAAAEASTTKSNEEAEEKKSEEENKESPAADTTEFTFTSGTNDSKDANPFSKGFNPFGGDFNPFGSTANNNQSGGFTFTFPANDTNKTEDENKTEKQQQQQQPASKENENKNEKQEETKNNENNEPEKKEEQENNNNNNNNNNVNDTLDDDLFDMNSIEKFQPKPQCDSSSDVFNEIKTFPVSNSTSNFLSLKQKKESKSSTAATTLQSDSGIDSKAVTSIPAEKSHHHQNGNNNNNAPIISIIGNYTNIPQDITFSASDEIEDPSILEIMSDKNPMGSILKKFVKPPENDFYGSFEKDPHPIRFFPKFEDTKAAKVLADFVTKEFGITATFASTSKKQQQEIDVNSIFNAPGSSEANYDDDFLLMI